MPRIPLRTEPYASPLRQHRHFKSKRDLILRSLGKSSYINGSQFVVLFISARGDVETYASELLQDVSADPIVLRETGHEEKTTIFKWDVIESKRRMIKDVGEQRRREVAEKRGLFGVGVEHDGDLDMGLECDGDGDDVVDDADEGRMGSGNGRERREESPTEQRGRRVGSEEDEDGDKTLVEDPNDFISTKQEDGITTKSECLESLSFSSSSSSSTITTTTQSKTHDLFMPEPTPNTLILATTTPSKTRPRTFSSASQFKTPAQPIRSVNPSTSAMASASIAHGSSRRPRDDMFLPSSPCLASSPHTGGNPDATTHLLSIPESSIESYYIDRFNSLQQTTCKLVVKTWIKVVEPKKQTRFPYNKGEEAKPTWWPEGVRHREPDHLMKPERTQLLLAILRMPGVNPTRLEVSTAEMLAYISQAKMRILREIYTVAKEEERRKIEGATGDIVVRLPGAPTDTNHLPTLSLTTPDRSHLSTSQPATPLVTFTIDAQSSTRKRKSEMNTSHIDNKENILATQYQPMQKSPPSGSSNNVHSFKRARASSTLEMYGNQTRLEQLTPLRSIAGNGVPFSSSPLVREKEPAYAQPQQGWAVSPQPGGYHYDPMHAQGLMPVWNGQQGRAGPPMGHQPSPDPSTLSRSEAYQPQGTSSKKRAPRGVTRLPLPSLNLPTQYHGQRGPVTSMPQGQAYYYPSASPSPAIMQQGYYHPGQGQEMYVVASPQPPSHPSQVQGQDQGASKMTSPYLMTNATSTPYHPQPPMFAPTAQQPQNSGLGFYDTFSPMQGGTGMATDSVFPFENAMTGGGEVGGGMEEMQDEYVWTER